MTNDKELPPFKSEAEEAQWWFDHRDEHDARLLKAVSDGTARRVLMCFLNMGLLSKVCGNSQCRSRKKMQHGRDVRQP